MIQAIVEIPNPTFQQGDVVQWNELVLHIYSVTARGGWAFRNGRLDTTWSGDYEYNVAVQVGNSLEGSPLRPGTILCMRGQSSVDDSGIPFKEKACKIEWNQPIIEPDTEDNILERWKQWDNAD